MNKKLDYGKELMRILENDKRSKALLTVNLAETVLPVYEKIFGKSDVLREFLEISKKEINPPNGMTEQEQIKMHVRQGELSYEISKMGYSLSMQGKNGKWGRGYFPAKLALSIIYNYGWPNDGLSQHNSAIGVISACRQLLFHYDLYNGASDEDRANLIKAQDEILREYLS